MAFLRCSFDAAGWLLRGDLVRFVGRTQAKTTTTKQQRGEVAVFID